MEVGLSLGTNLGDRVAQLARATQALAALREIRILAESPIYETSPVDVPARYADLAFLNSVLIVEYSGRPREVLAAAGNIEQAMHRERGERNGPRVIDIDVIYAGDHVVDEPELQIPHPRAAQRRFVLQPLADLRPALVMPGQQASVADLLSALPADETVVRFAP